MDQHQKSRDVIDNLTVFVSYEDRITADNSQLPKNVPVLLGTNTNEGVAIVPFPTSTAARSAQQCERFICA
ncbi:hypothetical protein V2G26_020023 [Clonostachys chloroleuca]